MSIEVAVAYGHDRRAPSGAGIADPLQGAAVTDYGPRTEEVRRFLERVSRLTHAELAVFRAATTDQETLRTAGRTFSEAFAAAIDAAEREGLRQEQSRATVDAQRALPSDAAAFAATTAIGDVGAVLVVSHLLSDDDVATLLGAWVAAIGDADAVGDADHAASPRARTDHATQ
jgi:hypothetical protein